MSTNKHAQIRYRALDKCFSNFSRKFFMADLVDACSKAIYDYTGTKKTVSRRQIFDDMTYMESKEGFSAPIQRLYDGKKKYYQYEDTRFSINQQPLSPTELNQLKDTIYMLNRFNGMPQFDWMYEVLARFESSFNLNEDISSMVNFEHNPYLKGLGFFSDIFNAITNKTVLKVTYKKFGKDSSEKIFHPYFLKQYNNRWFLFGFCEQQEKKNPLTNLAIDRIEKIETVYIPYIENQNIDFEEYFEDVIGVTVYQKDTEQIILEIDNKLFPYVETKPLHGSQKIKMRNELTTTIELNLIINYELENLLLGYIDKIKIVAPNHLKEKMLNRLKEAIIKNA